MSNNEFQKIYSAIFKNMWLLNDYVVSNYIDNKETKKNLNSDALELLFNRSAATYRSIIILLENSLLIDARSLNRVLLESVINFMYLSKNNKSINDYKQYSTLKLYDNYQTILDKTKYFNDLPELLQLLFNDNDIIDGKISAKLMKTKKKEMEELIIKWDNIRFEDKINDLEISVLSLQSIWKTSSDSVHSGWESLLITQDDESIDFALKEIVVSSSENLERMIKYYNRQIALNTNFKNIEIVNMKLNICRAIDPKFPF